MFTRRSSFSRCHAELLVENGIAEKASEPGVLSNVPFTVVAQVDRIASEVYPLDKALMHILRVAAHLEINTLAVCPAYLWTTAYDGPYQLTLKPKSEHD